MPVVAAPGAAPSMALHELVTNAAKYGALSVHDGRVDATWSRRDDSCLRLIWSERGGPRVVPPTRAGLGSGVIEQTVRDQPCGDGRFGWRTEAVVCEIAVPWSTLTATSRAA